MNLATNTNPTSIVTLPTNVTTVTSNSNYLMRSIKYNTATATFLNVRTHTHTHTHTKDINHVACRIFLTFSVGYLAIKVTIHYF
jgi:hypothetical protein